MAIRLLQEAAERGEIDPWDVDVIAVVDGFLDQLRQRISFPRLLSTVGGSFEQDLAASSEAFLAASALVGLKAELLETATFSIETSDETWFDAEDHFDESGIAGGQLPHRPETLLKRRPVAPPPLQRPVTLGELIRQLEDIAERLDQEDGRRRERPASARRYSDRAAIAQVTALAHREKLPETTAALSVFLKTWSPTENQSWVDFDHLAEAWAGLRSGIPCDDLDRDRIDVFWALLFLSSQGQVELQQLGGLFGRLILRRVIAKGSDVGPAPAAVAA